MDFVFGVITGIIVTILCLIGLFAYFAKMEYTVKTIPGQKPLYKRER